MLRRTLALLALLAGCSTSSTAPDEPGVPRGKGYKGPAVTAGMVDGEALTLHVSVKAPANAYRLELVETRWEGDEADVYLKLTEPLDSPPPMQPPYCEVEVALERRPRVLRVYVSRWFDGVQYVRKPDDLLAATIPGS